MCVFALVIAFFAANAYTNKKALRLQGLFDNNF